MENLEMEILTATKVADEDRMNFWLRYVGMAKMLAFERHVYCWMRRLCPHYDGGYWEFYDLSNGGFYIAPAGEKKMWLTWPGNYFNDEMSADAAGIVVTLIAFLRVHFSGENDAEDVRAQIPGAVREDGDFSFRMHRQF